MRLEHSNALMLLSAAQRAHMGTVLGYRNGTAVNLFAATWAERAIVLKR